MCVCVCVCVLASAPTLLHRPWLFLYLIHTHVHTGLTAEPIVNSQAQYGFCCGALFLLCHTLPCSHESLGHAALQHPRGNRASGCRAGDVSGMCSFLVCVCVCVVVYLCLCVCVSVSNPAIFCQGPILRHIVCYSQQHSTFSPPPPPHSSALPSAHALHSSIGEECVVDTLSIFSSPLRTLV